MKDQIQKMKKEKHKGLGIQQDHNNQVLIKTNYLMIILILQESNVLNMFKIQIQLKATRIIFREQEICLILMSQQKEPLSQQLMISQVFNQKNKSKAYLQFNPKQLIFYQTQMTLILINNLFFQPMQQIMLKCLPKLFLQLLKKAFKIKLQVYW